MHFGRYNSHCYVHTCMNKKNLMVLLRGKSRCGYDEEMKIACCKISVINIRNEGIFETKILKKNGFKGLPNLDILKKMYP